MAKDKDTTLDTSPSPPKPDAGTPPAPAKEVAPTMATAAPVAAAQKASRKLSSLEIVEAIKSCGPAFSQAERNEIIYAVSALPPVAQSPTPPSPYDGVKEFRFSVSWGDKSDELTAKNPREAWALACDGWRAYPSPKSGKVECLGAA